MMGKKYLLITEESASWNTIKEHLYRLFFERGKKLELSFYDLNKELENFREYGNKCFEPDDEFANLLMEAIKIAEMQNLFSFDYGEHEEE